MAVGVLGACGPTMSIWTPLSSDWLGRVVGRLIPGSDRWARSRRTSCRRLEPGGRLTATNATLRQLIQSAYQRYGFDRREIEGGPAWIDAERFDVVAEAAAEHAIEPDGVSRQTSAHAAAFTRRSNSEAVAETRTICGYSSGRKAPISVH